MKIYKTLEELKKAAVNELCEVEIDRFIKGKYRIIEQEGMEANGYSVIFLDRENIYAVREYEEYNKWAENVKKKTFIAHKGYNSWVDNYFTSSLPTINGTYPENTPEAVEHAVRLGFKMVEIDITTTKDGVWVLSHDANDKTLGGEGTKFSTLTFDEIKNRPLVRQWRGGGYWCFSDNLKKEYTEPLEKVLKFLSGKGIYLILDAKSYDHTEEEMDKLAEIIENSGMKEYIAVFAGALEPICKRVSGVIAAYAQLPSENIDAAYLTMRAKGNFMLSIGTPNVPKIEKFMQKYDVPVGVWVVDDYFEAQNLFDKGVDFVLSNYCLNDKADLSDYKEITSLSLEDLKIEEYILNYKNLGLRVGDVILVEAETNGEMLFNISPIDAITARFTKFRINGKKTAYYTVNDAYFSDILLSFEKLSEKAEILSLSIKILRESARGEK